MTRSLAPFGDGILRGFGLWACSAPGRGALPAQNRTWPGKPLVRARAALNRTRHNGHSADIELVRPTAGRSRAHGALLSDEADGTMTGTALRECPHALSQQVESAHDARTGSMCFANPMDISLRTGIPADAVDCGRICYEAFADLASRHGYKTLFRKVEEGIGLMSWLLSTASFYTVVAEVKGRVVGSGTLQEWDKAVAGIALISVDPTFQGNGVGARLMGAMTTRATEAGFVGVRLVQEAYNRHSFSLYSRLGFEVREMLVRFSEQPKLLVIPGYTVRPATVEDAWNGPRSASAFMVMIADESCVYSINEGTARVVEHDRRISGYMTGLGGVWHSLGESNEDLKALMASGGEFGGNGFLVPAREYPRCSFGAWHKACVSRSCIRLWSPACQRAAGSVATLVCLLGGPGQDCLCWGRILWFSTARRTATRSATQKILPR